jgi:hypothetical protein
VCGIRSFKRVLLLKMCWWRHRRGLGSRSRARDETYGGEHLGADTCVAAPVSSKFTISRDRYVRRNFPKNRSPPSPPGSCVIFRITVDYMWTRSKSGSRQYPWPNTHIVWLGSRCESVLFIKKIHASNLLKPMWR